MRTAIPVPNNTRAKWLADIHKLSEFLWDTNTRNFYGHFHGSSSAFMGLDQDIWMNNLFQRYRFAFLDGCDTAEPPEITLRSFGASFEEIQNGMTVAQLALPDASPLPLSYYENLKLRPGAFLGWNVQLPNSYLLNAPQTDPTTGLSCSWSHYPAVCNFHTQWVFYWVLESQPLVQAINLAGSAAWTSTSSPGPNNPPTGFAFNPTNNLVIYGYTKIGFSQYNSAGDTW